jgi:hypothetical protein
MSEVNDSALDWLMWSQELRRDVAAYARQPVGEKEFALAEPLLELDLDDAAVGYGGTLLGT